MNWSPTAAARMFSELFPVLGRLMSMRLREAGEEESTMMQIRVLMHLKEQSITTSELARYRRVSLQSASVLVQGLVDRGWVVRVPDPNDRRRSILQVTEEGAAHAKMVHEHFINTLAELLSQLTPEELNGAALFLPGLHRLVEEQMKSNELSETQS